VSGTSAACIEKEKDMTNETETTASEALAPELTTEQIFDQARLERLERERRELHERIERERLERFEAERAARAEWHAAGRAKIVCSVCRRSPFDGFELYRRGELFCAEHLPPALPTVVKASKKKAA
jgi:hypothetical protein